MPWRNGLKFNRLTAGFLAAFIASTAQAALPKYSGEIIVQLKDIRTHELGINAVQDRIKPAQARVAALGKDLKVQGLINRNFWIVKAPEGATDAQLEALAKELETGDYGVLSAEPSRMLYIHNSVYNDPFWTNGQERLYDQSKPSGYDNGITQLIKSNPQAGANTFVSIIDTGKRSHNDMDSTIAAEVNFGPETNRAKNDSTALTVAECNAAGSFAEADDLTHGLAMASLAVATRNNAIGMVGASAGKHYSVRALPTCFGGGSESTIAQGILWSAGLDMDGPNGYVARGFPRNDTPATVINLSLGSDSTCRANSILGSAITRAISAGSVVVSSAGNSGRSTIGSPANCPGVISVGALGADGDSAGYSNVESVMTTNLFGGNVGFDEGIIIAADNNDYDRRTNGTSQASALASGVLASVLDLAGSNRPNNADLINLISSTGKPFENSRRAQCASGDCGTRMDAVALVKALNSSVDTDTLFRSEVLASSFNLPNIGVIELFTDASGSTDGLRATILADASGVRIESTRSGTFKMRVGSQAYANQTDRSQLATADVVISQFGDVSVTLADIKRTQANSSDIVPNAGSIQNIREFTTVSGNFTPGANDRVFEITNGAVTWIFPGSATGSFRFTVDFTENTTQQGLSQQSTQSRVVTMNVNNGTPTTYAQQTNPSGPGTTSPAPAANSGGSGGGGGGAMSLIGLLMLAFGLSAVRHRKQLN